MSFILFILFIKKKKPLKEKKHQKKRMLQNELLTEKDCEMIISLLPSCQNNGEERTTYWVENTKIVNIMKKIEKLTKIPWEKYENMHVVKYDNTPHAEFFDAYDLNTEIGKKYTEKLGQRIYTVMGMISNAEIYVDFRKLGTTIKLEKGKVLFIKNTLENSSIRDEKYIKTITNKGTKGYLFNIYIRDNSNYDYMKNLETFYSIFSTKNQIKQVETFTFSPQYDESIRSFLKLVENKPKIINPKCFSKNYNFNEYNPVVIEDILNPIMLKEIQNYIHKSIDKNFYILGDYQSKRYKTRDDILTRILHYEFLPLIEHVTQQKLRPSYTYLSAYIDGADLKPHTDNPDCVYTVSYIVYKSSQKDDNVRSRGTNYKNPDMYYPIFVHKTKQDEKYKGIYSYTPDKKECVEIDCKVGDAMIFSGVDHIHFREKLNGRYYTLLLHYVPK